MVLPVLVAQPRPFALGSHLPLCAWNVGNVLPRTFKTVGKDAQYGEPDVAIFGGTSTSAVMANPEFTGGLRRSLLTDQVSTGAARRPGGAPR